MYEITLKYENADDSTSYISWENKTLQHVRHSCDPYLDPAQGKPSYLGCRRLLSCIMISFRRLENSFLRSPKSCCYNSATVSININNTDGLNFRLGRRSKDLHDCRKKKINK